MPSHCSVRRSARTASVAQGTVANTVWEAAAEGALQLTTNVAFPPQQALPSAIPLRLMRDLKGWLFRMKCAMLGTYCPAYDSPAAAVRTQTQPVSAHW